MSLYLKSRCAKPGRPSKHEVESGARERRVIVNENPYFMDIVIDLCIGYKQSQVHEKLCIEFLGQQQEVVTKLFENKFSDGFRPAEILPGGEFTELPGGLAEYKELVKNLERRRRKGPLEWGYTPSEYMPYYTGWKNSLNKMPLDEVTWQVMRFYDGKLFSMNAHNYTLERWSDEMTGHHHPDELDLEVLNAGFLTVECGRSNGKGKCQCNRELIFSPDSYRSFPLVSPYLRLERQSLIRNAYVNVIRQSDEGSDFKAEELCKDEDMVEDEDEDEEDSFYDLDSAEAKAMGDNDDFDRNRKECRPGDWYLMLMMPDDLGGDRDLERYIEVPVGRMNGVELVVQKITVCPDTFQKMFCLSPNQDLQLLRWRKGVMAEKIDINNLIDVTGKLHRCRTPIQKSWPMCSLDKLSYPGKDALPQKTRPVLTGKRARSWWMETIDFGFNFEDMAKRGVVGRSQSLITDGEIAQYEADRALISQLDQQQWDRFIAGLRRNDRDELWFGAWEAQTTPGMTMWVPAEGYQFAGRCYKFRIDSYFQETWWEGLRCARGGKFLEEGGKHVEGTEYQLFESLCMQPGTLSIKAHLARVSVKRSGFMKPPDLIEGGSRQLQQKKNNKEQHETWFHARMLGYPRDPDENQGAGSAARRKTPITPCINVSDFVQEFGHGPTWDRNLWSKNWQREYRAMCDMEESDQLPPWVGDKPESLQRFTRINPLGFCDNTGVTGDSNDDYGQNHGFASYRSFCLRVYVFGLEDAFMREFGHPPTTNMNLWSNNRTAERRAYWVVTGRPHDDPAPQRPPFLLNWEDDCADKEDFPDRRDLSTAVVWEEHMQRPHIAP